jgi:hypothetical protein
MLGEQEIENRFGFHKAAIEGPNATNEMHRDLRHAFKTFAKILDEILPDHPSAKRYEDLERTAMWAHKAVARTAPLIEE